MDWQTMLYLVLIAEAVPKLRKLAAKIKDEKLRQFANLIIAAAEKVWGPTVKPKAVTLLSVEKATK